MGKPPGEEEVLANVSFSSTKESWKPMRALAKKPKSWVGKLKSVGYTNLGVECKRMWWQRCYD